LKYKEVKRDVYVVCQDKDWVRPDGKDLKEIFLDKQKRIIDIERNSLSKYIDDIPYITDKY